MHVLENCIRKELDAVAPRIFAVLKPLKVESCFLALVGILKIVESPNSAYFFVTFCDKIFFFWQVVIKEGLDADVTLSVPNHPTDTSKGERQLVLTKVRLASRAPVDCNVSVQAHSCLFPSSRTESRSFDRCPARRRFTSTQTILERWTMPTTTALPQVRFSGLSPGEAGMA